MLCCCSTGIVLWVTSDSDILNEPSRAIQGNKLHLPLAPPFLKHMQNFLPELRHPTDLEAESEVEIQPATEPGESRTQP